MNKIDVILLALFIATVAIVSVASSETTENLRCEKATTDSGIEVEICR